MVITLEIFITSYLTLIGQFYDVISLILVVTSSKSLCLDREVLTHQKGSLRPLHYGYGEIF